MQEIWKSLEPLGFPGYQVSSQGNLMQGNQHVKIYVCTKKGYRSARIGESSNRRQMSIHRLVALAFIDNPESKECVNHKDGNPGNNCLENLEWVTVAENNAHARDTGLWRVAKGVEHRHTFITEADVRFIRQNAKKAGGCYTLGQLAEMFGFSSPMSVGNIVNRKTWAHVE